MDDTRKREEILLATEIRRIWLQGIAIVSLFSVIVADNVLLGYHQEDVFLVGAIVVLALGGRILDTLAGPPHSSPPSARELTVYLSPPLTLATLSLLVAVGDISLMAAMVSFVLVVFPIAAYLLLRRPLMIEQNFAQG